MRWAVKEEKEELAVTTGAIYWGIDVPRVFEFEAHLFLVLAFRFSGPVEIDHLIHRAQVLLRGAVTF